MAAPVRPAGGGTPGGESRASRNDPGDSSPGAPTGLPDSWATLGFMEEKVVDPSANQGCSDVFEYDKRNQTEPDERFPRIKKAQRGDIEPLKSDWV